MNSISAETARDLAMLPRCTHDIVPGEHEVGWLCLSHGCQTAWHLSCYTKDATRPIYLTYHDEHVYYNHGEFVIDATGNYPSRIKQWLADTCHPDYARQEASQEAIT